jgi:hypothetical protein
MRWYTSLVLIVLLGVALIVYSRYERQHPAASTQPAVGAHWFVALAVDVCGNVQPSLPTNPNEATTAPGLHTAGDGVIEIDPARQSDAGDNATLGRFVQEYPGMALSPTSVRLPGTSTHRNGETCPSGTPDAGRRATLQVKVWPSFAPPGSTHPFVPSDPTTLKLEDGQLVTIAFVPAGAQIPKPPQAVITTMLQDRASAGSGTTTTTSPLIPTTTTPGSTTTTSTPAASTTTTSAPRPGASTTTTTARP